MLIVFAIFLPFIPYAILSHIILSSMETSQGITRDTFTVTEPEACTVSANIGVNIELVFDFPTQDKFFVFSMEPDILIDGEVRNNEKFWTFDKNINPETGAQETHPATVQEIAAMVGALVHMPSLGDMTKNELITRGRKAIQKINDAGSNAWVLLNTQIEQDIVKRDKLEIRNKEIAQESLEALDIIAQYQQLLP